MRVCVWAADISDVAGLDGLLWDCQTAFPRLTKVWADGAYPSAVEWLQADYGIELEVVSRAVDQVGFVVLPRRWVVERTIAWLCRNRRLSKDYEYHGECSESMVYLASIHLLTRRLSKPA